MNHSQRNLGIFHITADDYHAFDNHGDIAATLRLFDKSYKLEEVGFSGAYHAIAYPGSADASIVELVRALILNDCN